MICGKNNINHVITQSKTWISSWHLHKKDYNFFLQQDFSFFCFVRSLTLSNLFNIDILNFRIYRNKLIIFLDFFYTSSSNFDNIVFQKISANMNKILRYDRKVFLFVHRVKFMVNSNYISLKIAKFLEKKIKFKSKVIRTFLNNIFCHCLGVKIQCSGRLNDVDMAKTIVFSMGFMPLQKLESDIDFSNTIANTNVGLQSIKVWIYR